VSKRLAAWIPAVVVLVLAGVALWWYGQKAETRKQTVDAACMQATVLAQVGLLEQAQRASTRVEKEKRDPDCPDVADQLRALRAQRTAWFDEAWSNRRAAQFARRGVSDRAVRRWRRAAFDAYLQGLALDPASPGARRGLRAMLRSGRPRSPLQTRKHCEQARKLLDIRLLREARAEYVRVRAAGRVCVDEIGRSLRTRRSVAYTWLREAEALDRADDRDGARRQYLAALAIDPNLGAALDGLDRTRLEIPEPVSWADVAKAPALTSLGSFLVIVGAGALFVLGGTLIRILRGVGRRVGWVAKLYHRIGAGTLVTDGLDNVPTDELSGLQWEALHGATAFLSDPPAPDGGDAGGPTEKVRVTGYTGVSSDALEAVPLLKRLNQLARFGRWIAGERRASISVAPEGAEAFSVLPWITPEGRPRGAARRVMVPYTGPPAVDDLAELVADAILFQKAGG
jgi:hypothetical protein